MNSTSKEDMNYNRAMTSTCHGDMEHAYKLGTAGSLMIQWQFCAVVTLEHYIVVNRILRHVPYVKFFMEIIFMIM